MVNDNGRPRNDWSKMEQPEFAQKAEIIRPDTAEELEAYVKKCKFTTISRNFIDQRIALIKGNEFRNANFSPLEALERAKEFKINILIGIQLLPREERERPEFENAINGLLYLFGNSITSSTRDEFGRNNFLLQYVNTSMSFKNETADIHDNRVVREAAMVQQQEQKGWFSLNRLPLVGGMLK